MVLCHVLVMLILAAGVHFNGCDVSSTFLSEAVNVFCVSVFGCAMTWVGAWIMGFYYFLIANCGLGKVLGIPIWPFVVRL